MWWWLVEGGLSVPVNGAPRRSSVSRLQPAEEKDSLNQANLHLNEAASMVWSFNGEIVVAMKVSTFNLISMYGSSMYVRSTDLRSKKNKSFSYWMMKLQFAMSMVIFSPLPPLLKTVKMVGLILLSFVRQSFVLSTYQSWFLSFFLMYVVSFQVCLMNSPFTHIALIVLPLLLWNSEIPFIGPVA